MALNYGQSTGSAQLLRFVTEHTEVRSLSRIRYRELMKDSQIVHHPPYKDWQCCMTVGSTSALDLAYRMFCTRGECESFFHAMSSWIVLHFELRDLSQEKEPVGASSRPRCDPIRDTLTPKSFRHPDRGVYLFHSR